MGRIQFLTVATALILGLAACKRGAPGGGDEAAGLEDAAAQRLHAMSDLMKASTMFSFKTVEDHHRVRANGEARDEHFTREIIVRRPDAGHDCSCSCRGPDRRLARRDIEHARGRTMCGLHDPDC